MIITISHQKGGVGKSTILWNLLIEKSKNNKISVLDLDGQKTITSSLVVRKNNLGNLNNISIVNIKDQNAFIDLVENFPDEEILFIDSGGFDSSMNRLAIAASNIVLTPVSSKFYELLGLQTYEKNLKDMEEKTKFKLQTHVFLNKINHNTKDFEEINEFIDSSKYFNRMQSVFRQRVDFENSPSYGKSVIEFNPDSKAAHEFKLFMLELDELMKDVTKQNQHEITINN